LPVGAASRMRRVAAAARVIACPVRFQRQRLQQRQQLTTVVVLPVPGPPVMMLKPLRAASAQAIFCQSVARRSRSGRKQQVERLAQRGNRQRCLQLLAIASRRSSAPRTSCSYCQ
jgi:hypothetical protein